MYFTKTETVNFEAYDLKVAVEMVTCETKEEPRIVSSVDSLCLTEIDKEIRCKANVLRELVKDQQTNFVIPPDFRVLVDLSSEEVLKNILKRIGKALVESGYHWRRIEITRTSKDIAGILKKSVFSLVNDKD
jgi:hypothetical protein